MKKIGLFIPAIVFTAFYGLITLGGGFSIVSPIVYGWIALFIISGLLLSKDKVWGSFFAARNSSDFYEHKRHWANYQRIANWYYSCRLLSVMFWFCIL